MYLLVQFYYVHVLNSILYPSSWNINAEGVSKSAFRIICVACFCNFDLCSRCNRAITVERKGTYVLDKAVFRQGTNFDSYGNNDILERTLHKEGLPVSSM